MAILNRDGDELSIFNRKFEVDYALPKWEGVMEKLKGDLEAKKESSRSVEEHYSRQQASIPDGAEKLRHLMKRSREILIDPEFYDNLTADDITVMFDRRFSEGFFEPLWDSAVFDSVTPDDLPEFNGSISLNSYVKPERDLTVISELKMSEKENEICEANSELYKLMKKKPFFWTKSRYQRELDRLDNKLHSLIEDKKKFAVRGDIPEKTYELGVLEFFEKVKLTTLENAGTYYNRIEPYLKALQNAKKMGQTALCEKLLAMIVINKLESILLSYGYGKKITERQVVDFVKKTDKGVDLCYIKNFSRPIPDEVIEKKVELDKLHVFDNYCILYYDPSGKSYKKTQEELEEERKKKSDPILFGMIRGSRNLYYVADWIDEHCDLTLEKFIKESESDPSNFVITEKISI